MSFGMHEKKHSLTGVVPWFRFMLWWGTEITMQVLRVQRPKPEIVRLSQADAWPVSSWVFAQDKVYGIFFQRYEPEVCVYEFPNLEKN